MKKLKLQKLKLRKNNIAKLNTANIHTIVGGTNKPPKFSDGFLCGEKCTVSTQQSSTGFPTTNCTTNISC